MEEIFESAINSAGSFAGVFEFDGEVAYFYLYGLGESEGSKVISANKITLDSPQQGDIEIKWSADDEIVFLLISGGKVAAFNCVSGIKYGGADGEDFTNDVLARISIPKQ